MSLPSATALRSDTVMLTEEFHMHRVATTLSIGSAPSEPIGLAITPQPLPQKSAQFFFYQRDVLTGVGVDNNGLNNIAFSGGSADR